jgi:hypothetical protein
MMIGSTAAPRLTPDKVAEYRALAGTVEDREARYYMLDLCRMVEVWLETPDLPPGPPNVLGFPVTPLTQEEIARLDEVVPFRNECEAMGKSFESLQGDQRNAAFHLLWYAYELTADRQPCTKDLLPADMQ